MTYRLYYWPTLPGRGELARLILEDAGADYVDVARLPEDQGGGFPAILRFYEGEVEGAPVFAPPILEVGDLRLAQTHVICAYLGEALGLAPVETEDRLVARQHHLTLLDLVDEAHDVHHPLGASLYYDDQKDAAKLRAEQFATSRLPRFLAHFERVLERGGAWFVGDACSYVDLTAFQVVEGLAYAFPNAFREASKAAPRLLALRDRVAGRPNVASYLASERRLSFNEDGIFRHYPELDGA